MPEPQSTPPQPVPAPNSGRATAEPDAALRSAALEGPPGELPKENVIWAGRTSWKHFLPGIVVWLAAMSAMSWLLMRGENPAAWVRWLLVILWSASGLFVLGRMIGRILGNRYRLTTQRLFIEKGIFSQTIDQTELMRVDDVRMHKTVLDRVFGLGTVEVMATDTTNPKVCIVGVSAPETVAEHIRSNMRIMRKRALFVENL